MAYTEPNWSHSALITIDTQNDFTLSGAVAEIPGTAAVVPHMRRLLHAFRAARQPVVHVVRIYIPDGSNVDLCRREAIESGARVVAPGSPGAELVAGIRPEHAPPLDADSLLRGALQPLADLEWAMYKPRWGAFYQTGLESFLRSHRIDTLVFSGCSPRTSMYEASERDFRVVMAMDAMSGGYDKGFAEMEGIGVKVMTTSEIVERCGQG